MVLDPRDFGLLVTLMFRRLGNLPEELMRLIWNAYLELYAQMIIDRTNDRRHLRDLLDEHGF
jgi:hypothetical protein